MTVIMNFLNNIEEPQKSELLKIYEIIKKAAPDAEETISYGMPVFKYKSKYLIGFSAFKDHMSLFPGPEVIEILKNDLKKFKTSKGTIQFTVENKLPSVLIKQIIKLRILDIDN